MIFLNTIDSVSSAPKNLPPKFPRSGFTLVELLVTMVIIMLLAVMAAPAVSKISRGFVVDTSARRIVDELNLARQIAQTKNCLVQVRLYKLPDINQPSASSPSVYRAMQLFQVANNGTNALGKVTYIDNPAIISSTSNTSSLMDDSITALQEQSSSGQPPLPNVQLNYKYRVFQFKPDGSTDLPMSGTWFLSVHAQNDPLLGNGLPLNFATIQIDPQSGRTKVFRP